jgi:hypothetical protein
MIRLFLLSRRVSCHVIQVGWKNQDELVHGAEYPSGAFNPWLYILEQ